MGLENPRSRNQREQGTGKGEGIWSVGISRASRRIGVELDAEDAALQGWTLTSGDANHQQAQPRNTRVRTPSGRLRCNFSFLQYKIHDYGH